MYIGSPCNFCIHYYTTTEMQLRRRVIFQDAYGELLPFVDEWRSIGILMEVPLHIIKKIADGGQTDSFML